MQAYKEIQVPVEKVKEVYEQFYKKLKELEQQAKEKEERNREAFYASEEKNKKLRQEYFNMLGCGRDDSYLYSNFSYFYDVSPVPDFLLHCEHMAEAVKNADGFITMTLEQVSYFTAIQSGKFIEKIKYYIEKPIEERESIYQKLINNLKKSETVQTPKLLPPANRTIPTIEHDQGSFYGALIGIFVMITLLYVMFI